MDLKAWVMMGGMALMAFAYMNFFYIPQQQEWQEKQRKRAEAEASKSPSPGTSPGTSPAASPGASPSGTAPTTSASAAPETSAAAPTPAPAGPLAAAETFAFTTPSHTIKLSSRGASLEDLTFKEIRESTFASVQSSEDDAREAQLFHLIKPFLPAEDGVFGLAVEPESYKDAKKQVWQHSALPGGGHRFSLVLPEQWRLEKDYLPPDPAQDGKAENPFHFRLVVRVVNLAEVPRDFSYWLHGTAGIVNQDVGRGSYGVEAVVAGRESGDVDTDMESANSFDEEDYGKPQVELAASSKDKTSVAYHGLVTKYFTSMVVPLKETRFERAEGWALIGQAGRSPTLKEDKEAGTVNDPKLQAITRGLVKVAVSAKQSQEQEFLIYVGPRQETDVFEQDAYAPHGLDELVYYGWALFAPIGRVLHSILGLFHSLFGNWGIAILCLTVMVRLLILPLSLMQQKSAIGMQKLTPELNALREKMSGADGQMTREQQMAFSQAQMALFKKHGVNPVGCLGPLFLQMPIFIALYQVCFQASDLRGAPFFFWINDLSSPDVLFRMGGFTLPFLDTNAFSLLPLILVCLYILQQKIQPPPADEKAAEQQKIMKFIFPVFGLLFYTMPSGLLIYWVASTLWGICEQKFVKNKLFPPEARAANTKASAAVALPGLEKVGETLEPAASPAASEGGEAPANTNTGGGGKGKKKRKNKKKRR
jgi:YidC/Oxa1 family membrane protein insertase